MNLTEQQKKGQEILNTIIKKSWEDESFKQELINSPNETLSKLEELNFKLPKNSNVVIEDQTDQNTIYLNIPRKLNYSNFELTDEQLEHVAGGETGVVASVVLVAALYYFDII